MKSSVSEPSRPTIRSWKQAAIRELRAAGIESASLDAQLLLAHAINRPDTWLIAHDDEALTTQQLKQLAEALARRCDREPLAYIVGSKEFYGRSFQVSPDVLIPRPESEDIISTLLELELPDNPTIYDIGSGSGCLAITAALELPEARVTATDISSRALQMVQKNADRLGASLTLQRTRLLDGVPDDSITAIVANLPYVDVSWQRSPETDYEPKLALFAPDQGLALINELIAQARHALTSGGYLLIESDVRQHTSIITTARDHRLQHQQTRGLVTCFRLVG